MNYFLGMGRYRISREWEELWVKCIKQYANPEPTNFTVLEVGKPTPIAPTYLQHHLQVNGNLGHVGDLLNGSKPHEFCGWSAGFLALAMIAYNAELDFLYLEQDALAFGPWIERIYADMGDGDFVFGRKMISAPWMPCAQSLFLVRHRFIPTLVREYLALGTDSDIHNLPEHKFQKIEEKYPSKVRRLSFGCDRERPIPFDDPVFYAQKWTEEELAEARRRGLL